MASHEFFETLPGNISMVSASSRDPKRRKVSSQHSFNRDTIADGSADVIAAEETRDPALQNEVRTFYGDSRCVEIGTAGSRFKNTKHKAAKEVVARRHDPVVNVTLPKFGENRVFSTWTEFFRALDAYTSEQFVVLRKRTSQSTAINNRNYISPSRGNYPAVPFVVPTEFFDKVQYSMWCTHGCRNQPRGIGLRSHYHVRYTACPASLIASVTKDGSGNFGIVVRKQITSHNHFVSKEICEMLKSKKIVPTSLLFGRVSRVSELQKTNVLVGSSSKRHDVVMTILKPVICTLLESSTLDFYPRMQLLKRATDRLMQVFSGATGDCNAVDQEPTIDSAPTEEDARETTSIYEHEDHSVGHPTEQSVAWMSSVACRTPLPASTTGDESQTEEPMQMLPYSAVIDDLRTRSTCSGRTSAAVEDSPKHTVDQTDTLNIDQADFVDMAGLPRSVYTRKHNKLLPPKKKEKLVHSHADIVVAFDEWTDSISIKDIARWLQFTRHQELVEAVFNSTPTVLSTTVDINRNFKIVDGDGSAESNLGVVFSKQLVRKITSEIRRLQSYKKNRSRSFPLSGLAVRVHVSLPKYQDKLIYAMEDYHNFYSIHKTRSQVLSWLKQEWSAKKSVYSVFPVLNRSDYQLASDIVSVLELSSLSMMVDLSACAMGMCPVADILTVGATNWLSQTPISAMLQDFCREQARSVCISSFVTADHLWDLPLEPAPGQLVVIDAEDENFSGGGESTIYKEWEIIVSACHVGGNHWTLAIIDITRNEILLYDPLNQDVWVDMTRERCEETLLPVVEDWRRRYADASDYEYVEIKYWDWHIIEGPTQSDGNSCGVLILAVAWCYLFEGLFHPFIQHQGNVPIEETDLYRLRILWRCLCAPGSRPIIPSPPSAPSLARIEEQIKAKLHKQAK